MKWIVLASALAFGGTALAQDMQTQPATPPAGQQTQPGTMGNQLAPDAATTPPPVAEATPADAPAPAADTMTPAPDQAASRPMSDATTATPPMAAAGEDPRGGYMPSGSAMSGPATPGARVTVRPSATPDQAFPPPAPLQNYPICKRNQYDNCRQRGG